MREDSQLPSAEMTSFCAMFSEDGAEARLPPVRRGTSFSALRSEDDGHAMMPPVRQNASFSAMFSGDDGEARLPAIAPGDQRSALPAHDGEFTIGRDFVFGRTAPVSASATQRAAGRFASFQQSRTLGDSQAEALADAFVYPTLREFRAASIRELNELLTQMWPTLAREPNGRV